MSSPTVPSIYIAWSRPRRWKTLPLSIPVGRSGCVPWRKPSWNIPVISCTTIKKIEFYPVFVYHVYILFPLISVSTLKKVLKHAPQARFFFLSSFLLVFFRVTGHSPAREFGVRVVLAIILRISNKRRMQCVCTVIAKCGPGAGGKLACPENVSRKRGGRMRGKGKTEG